MKMNSWIKPTVSLPQTGTYVVRKMKNQYYDQNRCRLTDCCCCYSTYMDARYQGEERALCCKNCGRIVPHGQGDGCEYEVIDDLMLNDYLEDS